MGDQDNVTKPELQGFIVEIKTDITGIKTELAKVTLAMTELTHKFDIMQLAAKADNDARYRLKEDVLKDAMGLLDDERFVDKCKPLIIRVVDEHLCNARDNGVKWMKAIETFVKLAIAVAAIYGGSTVINTQKSNQQALLDKIEQVQGE